jgi:hypothetical protein
MGFLLPSWAFSSAETKEMEGTMFLKKSICLFAAAAALGGSVQAHALPILAENAGVTVNSALTIYPDSDNPNVFYYMPNSSGLAFSEESKLPYFGFTYWGLSNGGPLTEAGAWLTFTMRLKSDADQQLALQSILGEGKRISVLPVQESVVSLTSTKTGESPASALFSEFHFGQKAGVMESEMGVNAVMTGVGAKVFKAAIDNPQLLKTDYCFKVTGLGPNMVGKIDVKWDRVYDYFQAGYSTGGWFYKKDIMVEVEKLKQKNLVSIRLDGGEATDMEKLYELTNTIIARLFQAELKASPGGASGGGWSLSRFSLRVIHKEELKEESWTISKRDLIDREFCLSLGLKDLGKYKDKIVKDADK